MKLKQLFLSTAALALLALPQVAAASEGGVELHHVEVDVTDQAAIRRGLEVFTNICMGCHSAKYITYKGLMDYPEIGISREQADELRGNKPLTAAVTTDLSPADAEEFYGKVPPDLSLIVPGRRGGASYVYSILTGFDHDPHGKIPDGNYNKYFPGNRIAMPDPLNWLDHDQADTATLEQQAHDVTTFLTFIGDPHQNERRAIGVWVMGFLVVLTLVLWMLKREVWKDVH